MRGKKGIKPVVFVSNRTLFRNKDDGTVENERPKYGEEYITIYKGTSFLCPSVKDSEIFDFSTLYDTSICLIPRSKKFVLNFKNLIEARDFGIVPQTEKRRTRKMKSQYLDFVDCGEDVKVYTKKMKKILYVGYIKKKNSFGEAKFVPQGNIVFGRHYLLALSRECAEIDKKEGNK